MWTKQHFERLADLISESETLEVFVNLLVEDFGKDNPLFKADKFRKRARRV
jgi:hypothetical protein